MRRLLFVFSGACLLACGGDDSDPAAAAGAGGGGAGGAGGQAASCEPSPARCASLGTDRPFRVSEHSAAYVDERAEMVVFGGSSAVSVMCSIPTPAFIAETWVFDDPCGAWTKLDIPGPSARGRHMSVYGGGAVWVFGGRYRDASTGYTLFDDLWSFDPAARSWSEVMASGVRPPARVNGALAWDDKRQRLWLYGGNTSVSGAAYTAVGDVWSFDPQASSWRQESPQGAAPANRLFHSMLYDPVRDRLVVFGGGDETAFNANARYFRDLWALDLDSLTWSELPHESLNQPEGRFWAGLSYDSVHDQYLLFGGHDDQALGNRNDAWRYTPDSAWHGVTPGDTLNSGPTGTCMFPVDFVNLASDAPERRNAHSFVWSESCGHALIFAGKTDCGATNDVWSFDGVAFQERVKSTEGEVCLRWRDDTSQCVDMCN